jgi:hypothetical protein
MGDGVPTAWVGLLDRSGEHQHVSLTALHAETEPTSTLEGLRTTYTDEASGVITCRNHGRLEAIGEFQNLTNVTDHSEGDTTLALHVLARHVAVPYGEHVLVLWPATGG